MSGAEREMTLDEWVGKLNPTHRIARELAELRAQVKKLTPREACQHCGCSCWACEGPGSQCMTKGRKDQITRLQQRCNELLLQKRGIRYLVHDFHHKFGYPVERVPHTPDDDNVRFRLKLIAEEFFELVDAALGDCKMRPWILKQAIEKTNEAIDLSPVDVDLVELVDAAADLDYVVEGTRLTFGIDGWPVLLEVQRANMSKAPSHLASADRAKVDTNVAKTPKPDGWTPPDIEGELRKQGWEPCHASE